MSRSHGKGKTRVGAQGALYEKSVIMCKVSTSLKETSDIRRLTMREKGGRGPGKEKKNRENERGVGAGS